jgi:hypothetical protein
MTADTKPDPASGRFVLRIDAGLHGALREAALRATVSLNELVARKLALPPISFAGRRVEPHFVHLPAADATLSGLWPEIAIDGVILVDRALTLALALASIRRAIVTGRLQRRIVHGQSYWVAA